MAARFAELDWRPTPMGDLLLRRRWDPAVATEVLEVKLGDEFLMSSMFTVAEEEMARLALAGLAARVGDPGGLDVVVGGLGLGYTALTVLEDPGVRSLTVVEALEPVIEWHRDGLIPAGRTLTNDPRCTLVQGDFFAMVRSGDGLDPTSPGRRFHALVVDIDHSPRHLLHPSHSDLYEPPGLHRVAELLHPGGVFALWSNDPPDDAFTRVLGEVFATAHAEVVRFPNLLQDRESTNTVYVATI
ncbi:spermidine synthase [Pseudonocardia sp. N23]|uniref:spermidine synthase n=1 Tax=Pseudonocardia sp. N23 TaxID=1987376 RepID=UPI000BFC2051|nr:spermidine synthase [Pseudonocardia sp. N23]GAY12940.1 spermidine synthase [Pseudonocardia sp. N23]